MVTCMKTENTSLLSDARAKLAPFRELRETFDILYERLASRDDLGVFIGGSLVKGTVTEVSDIDFQLIIRPGANGDAVRAWVKQETLKLGAVLAQFPADHLGRPDIEVYFLECNDKLVKIDIWTLEFEQLFFLNNSSYALVCDPDDFVTAGLKKLPGETAAPLPDFSDRHHKFVGWMWYTFAKIHRGGMLEAIESLDYMRSYVILPFAHYIEGNPLHGYRHIEKRLSPPRLTALRKTFAQNDSKAEVTRAFWATVEMFAALQQPLNDKLGGTLKPANFDRMVQRIRLFAEANP